MATSEDVKKLAALARISVPEETLPKFAAEFDAILGYIDQLADLNIKSGEPLLPYTNIFRADENPHESGIHTEKLVEQFPASEGNLLSVKQIIAHD
jgi:aspartyl-tRNA(Asn)/glutamyl-tRNA(Gln) amidotransferase subunit C